MIEILKSKISRILIFTIILMVTNNQLAKETLIYAIIYLMIKKRI